MWLVSVFRYFSSPSSFRATSLFPHILPYFLLFYWLAGTLCRIISNHVQNLCVFCRNRYWAASHDHAPYWTYWGLWNFDFNHLDRGFGEHTLPRLIEPSNDNALVILPLCLMVQLWHLVDDKNWLCSRTTILFDRDSFFVDTKEEMEYTLHWNSAAITIRIVLDLDCPNFHQIYSLSKSRSSSVPYSLSIDDKSHNLLCWARCIHQLLIR